MIFWTFFFITIFIMINFFTKMYFDMKVHRMRMEHFEQTLQALHLTEDIDTGPSEQKPEPTAEVKLPEKKPSKPTNRYELLDLD